MKKLLLIFTMVLMSTSCLVVEEVECVYDSDCGFSEACFGGECEYVPGSPPGAVTVGCNCSTTSHWPGQIRNNYTCESGQDVIQLCNYLCCDAYACYGAAWGAICL